MKRFEFLMGLLFLGTFGLFTIAVKQNLLTQFDFDTTAKLQAKIAHSFDTTFSFFSVLGSAEVTTIFLIIALFWYYKWYGVPIFLSYGFGLFIEILGKLFLDHEGPPHLFLRNNLEVSFPSSHIHTYHSYPSGHSYRTVFVIYVWCIFLFYSTESKLLRLLVVLAGGLFCAIMLVSRVSLGEHWATDVIGGSLLGIGLAMLSCSFRKRTIPKQKNKKPHASTTI